MRAVVSLLVMVITALPVFTLRLGLDDAGTDPPASTTRQAYDLLAQGFGPAFNGPFELLAALHAPADMAGFSRVVRAARPRVADSHDRREQPLQPPQHHHPAGGRRLGITPQTVASCGRAATAA
jgi:putative drug exporter of the RND superfamily